MNAITKLVSIFCSVLFLCIASAGSVYGCMCNPETVDKELKKNPNVVILTLQDVQIVDEKNDGDNISHSIFIVDRAFKGNLKTGDKLVLTNELSSCGCFFSKESAGTKYLFYLGEKPYRQNIWNVSRCSRSGSIKDRAADLLFLESLERMRNKTRLSGSVQQRVDEMTAQGKLHNWSYLSGRKIQIAGNGKKIELETDENGVYEIYDLPPGKYKITAETIDGYSFTNDDGNTSEVEIKANSHTENNICYSIRNAIRGKLYDSDGKPLKDTGLELIPADESFPLYHIGETHTDENGNFEFEGIPIGTFLIVVNKDGSLFRNEQLGTFYYPGTIDRNEASEITVGPGVFYDNFIVKVPKSAEVNIKKKGLK